MNRLILWFCAIGLCLAPAAALFADQHEDGGDMGRGYVVTTKTGQGDKMEAGIQAYYKCYGENGGKRTWRAWHSETGELGRYAFTTGGLKWAAFDKQEEASKACHEIFRDQFLPHIDTAMSEFNHVLPDHSHYDADKEYGVVWVVNFEVNDGLRFLDAVKQVTEAAKEADWGNYVWFDVVAGGHHAGDFYVVILGENFAAWDEDEGSLWEMVAGVHGQEKADELRGILNETIEDDWANIWRRRPDLGFIPEGDE